jgi:hypothetical protein
VRHNSPPTVSIFNGEREAHVRAVGPPKECGVLGLLSRFRKPYPTVPIGPVKVWAGAWVYESIVRSGGGELRGHVYNCGLRGSGLLIYVVIFGGCTYRWAQFLGFGRTEPPKSEQLEQLLSRMANTVYYLQFDSHASHTASVVSKAAWRAFKEKQEQNDLFTI